MAAIADGFSFVDAGRTFTCHVEGLSSSARGSWWWFVVSTEQHQRHAPFRACADDTSDDVRSRIVSYYDTLLARRAAPWQGRWQGRGGARPAPATAAVAAPADAPVAPAV